MAHAPPSGSTHTNRLASEPSPYLRQHQHNPVDWYPWGPEALERARRLDRPILLSVGYSACHWCHVMAHESFEDPGTAARMNAHFVNIKVDREERPDLDQLYQGVVQLTGRGGGWPLTVFLTPDLRPFFGGTYFPPEDRYGMPGFPRLLDALAETWRTRRKDVLEQTRAFEDGLTRLSQDGLEGAPGAFRPEDIVQAAQQLSAEVDPVHGGFGGAPKFPNPMNVALLLRGWRRGGGEALLERALLTLEKMARGGIYDQLGGGFHRYSVDERWLVPHFEKMLYDNAQLLHLYAEAHQLQPRPLFRQVVEETVAYLMRELRSPQGAFFAAQDADSEGEEGRYFVWTPEEVDRLLPPEQAELVKLRFNVQPGGNFEHGATVLEARLDPDALSARTGLSRDLVQRRLEQGRAALLAERQKRVPPGTDDKLLTGWNGLLLRGLALASRAFGRPEWAALGAQAADFFLENLWRDGVLFRTWKDGRARIPGFLEDYAGLAAGLVALFQATFEPRYLEAADALAREAVRRFWDPGRQAYLVSSREHTETFVPGYAVFDQATPSGASLLTEAQVGLAALTGDPAHLEQASRYLEKLREAAVQNPFAFGHLLLAADAALDGAAGVTVVGTGAQGSALHALVDRTWAPTVSLLVHADGAPVPARMQASLEGRVARAGVPATAYLCRRFSCGLPVTEPEALAEALREPGLTPR